NLLSLHDALPIFSESNRIHRFDDAGINENAADDKSDNAPKDIARGQVHLTGEPNTVERWTFSSPLVLEPFFPSAIQNENVFQLRFIPQPLRHFAAGVATLRTAVNDNLPLGRPLP